MKIKGLKKLVRKIVIEVIESHYGADILDFKPARKPFQVGDRVICAVNGPGHIIEIEEPPEDSTPIRVSFENGELEWYRAFIKKEIKRV